MPTIVMTLGALDLGDNFPIYSRQFEHIRNDEQGAGIKKITVTLSGFLEASNHTNVMALYEILKAETGKNDTTFTYSSDATVIHNAQTCWISGYTEPEDSEFGKTAVGDYSITLYWYEDTAQNLGVACTYGGYTFTKPPTWSRTIKPNRETHRMPRTGSTAEIKLSGILYGSSTANLQSAILALENAFLTDQTLTYGSFAHSVRVVDCTIDPAVHKNFAKYSITVKYDIGETVELRKRVSITRIHRNPVITEQPFCDNRIIELMNVSAQTITYKLRIKAENIATCRSLLAIEAENLIQPGGIEMPGGSEEWDEDDPTVDINIIKWYSEAVIANLPGTG